MTECLTNLVGMKSLCATDTEPMFYIDDIEGISQETLSRLATARDGSAENLFSFLAGSAQRLMLADIDTVIPPTFRILQQAASVCSSCAFTGFYQSALGGAGVIVKNVSNSNFSSLKINSVKVKTASTGIFTLVVGTKEIPMAFVSGEELEIKNINYSTTDPQVSIYFKEPIDLFAIECGANADCGCSGGPKTLASNILISGYYNGIEGSTQYGILPCAEIICGHDKVICNLVSSAPRIFSVAMLYLLASKVFETNVLSERINETASEDLQAKAALSQYYFGLYQERLKGNPAKNVLGISQILSQNLKGVHDVCVECNSPVNTAWAVG